MNKIQTIYLSKEYTLREWFAVALRYYKVSHIQIIPVKRYILLYFFSLLRLLFSLICMYLYVVHVYLLFLLSVDFILNQLWIYLITLNEQVLRCEDTKESMMHWLEENLQEITLNALEMRCSIGTRGESCFRAFRDLEYFITILETHSSIAMSVESCFKMARELKRDWLALSLISLTFNNSMNTC